MEATVNIQCPWCYETVEIWLDPQTRGAIVRDCEVCCRPWELHVERDGAKTARITVRRGN